MISIHYLVSDSYPESESDDCVANFLSVIYLKVWFCTNVLNTCHFPTAKFLNRVFSDVTSATTRSHRLESDSMNRVLYP
jgi:hypothetical protein